MVTFKELLFKNIFSNKSQNFHGGIKRVLKIKIYRQLFLQRKVLAILEFRVEKASLKNKTYFKREKMSLESLKKLQLIKREACYIKIFITFSSDP